MSRLRTLIVLSGSLLLIVSAYSQEPAPSEVVHPNQRVEVSNLPSLVADKDTPPELAALRIVLHAENIRCDEHSAIETAARTVTDHSLKDLVTKIAGTSCATDRGSVKINASFVPGSAIRGDDVIGILLRHKPQLIQYQGGIVVLYGVIYDEHLYADGSRMNVVRKFLMLDPRYLGERRFVSFTREKDDFTHVAGVARVEPAGNPN
ncbi:MAG TPA: hypothetical protein VG897_01575 [Terriglobales bacterium]|nr:hypothetical protein [Terriglobales bacterium]